MCCKVVYGYKALESPLQMLGRDALEIEELLRADAARVEGEMAELDIPAMLQATMAALDEIDAQEAPSQPVTEA